MRLASKYVEGCVFSTFNLSVQFSTTFPPISAVIGREGLLEYIDTVDEWIRHLRRRGRLGESRDVFCGQVLALHPLSGEVLSSPEHLAAIGGWIGRHDLEDLMRTGEVQVCDDYWDL